MSKRLINLITAIILIVAVYFGYQYFVAAPEVSGTPGVSVSDGSSEAETSSAEFLDLLLSVKNISLTKKLFDNPIFRDRLQDFSRALPERNIGRSNPFAPFGVGTVGTSSIRVSGAATTTATTSAPSRQAATTSTNKATSSAPSQPVDNGINF